MVCIDSTHNGDGDGDGDGGKPMSFDYISFDKQGNQRE
jgi:hypothetical protein